MDCFVVTVVTKAKTSLRESWKISPRLISCIVALKRIQLERTNENHDRGNNGSSNHNNIIIGSGDDSIQKSSTSCFHETIENLRDKIERTFQSSRWRTTHTNGNTRTKEEEKDTIPTHQVDFGLGRGDGDSDVFRSMQAN